MKDLVECINKYATDFYQEAQKNVNGNHAAGVRARKIALQMMSALKEFRKQSNVKNKKVD